MCIEDILSPQMIVKRCVVLFPHSFCLMLVCLTPLENMYRGNFISWLNFIAFLAERTQRAEGASDWRKGDDSGDQDDNYDSYDNYDKGVVESKVYMRHDASPHTLTQLQYRF